MKKRFLALFLVLVLVLFIVPTAAFALVDDTAQVADGEATPSDDEGTEEEATPSDDEGDGWVAGGIFFPGILVGYVGPQAAAAPAAVPEAEATVDTPKTGDNSLTVLWTALIALSVLGMGAVAVAKKIGE